MKLPYQTVSDPAATQNFETLQRLDILGLTAEGVLQLASTGTARKIAFGSTSLVFTASPQSAGAVVTHGLGTTPLAVTGIAQNGTGNAGIIVYTNTLTSTTFTLAADFRPGTAITATVPCYWIAIG